MQIFGSKPPPKTKLSSNSSTTSAKPTRSPGLPKKSVGPSQSSRPRQPLSATGPGSTGTTEQQASALRQMTGTIKETHELAGQAVGMLADITSPKTGEEPSRIDEILTALTAVVESQQRQEALLERVLRTLQPRSASRAD